ncbi:Ig-like domain-containing protein [Spartinivicinus ruber]|uniref:Ig-like domain-containing protein n=1 Tax=Spartinivicinus ruber TaxID=2683272 RepID=UPI0013CF8D36|nr:Ig-like domain-containing protein [Spartinivicinus ruber]
MAKHVLPLTLALGLSHLTTAVWAANQAPITQGHSETISKPGMHNSWVWAQDVDKDALTYKVVNQPKFGQVKMDPNTGKFTYTPTSTVAYDEFYYQVTDTTGQNSNKSVVQLNFDHEGQTSQPTNTTDSSQNCKVSGTVTGLDPETTAKITIASDTTLKTKAVTGNGSFCFEQYSNSATIHAYAPGYEVQNSSRKVTSGNTNFNFVKTPACEDGYSSCFKWEDSEESTSEYQSYINKKQTITFSNQTIEIVDNSAANALLHDYNIALIDTPDNAWSLEHASRLLNTIRMIPQPKRNSYGEQKLTPSVWEITDKALTDDVEVITEGKTKKIRINEKTFVNAAPRLVEIDGVKGRFFSKRLHHALVNVVTDFGNDSAAVEKIMKERFGVSLKANISQLTAGTTNESDNYFQPFLPREKVKLINIFEDMPTGMHKIEGLTHLVRRKNGMENPLYPSLAAIAWHSGENSSGNGYIEFMEKAFAHNADDFVHRLIVHEKAHYIYGKVINGQTRSDWAEVGGWYVDPNDKDGWSTSKQTEFVSAYAHTKNPNEDMAESIAYYILNPDKLRSRSPKKFDFIQKRIMKGSQYLSIIDQDMTFEVLNLYPDYIYPGKIKNVEIGVTTENNGDKKVHVTVKLHAKDSQLEGATETNVRVYSQIGTFKDFSLKPVDQSGAPAKVSTILTGSFVLDKNAPQGYWRPDQIALNDLNGNERFSGANDFGWKLYIDNANSDTTPPAYVPNSLTLNVTQDHNSYAEPVNKITAEWRVAEAVGMAETDPCFGSMKHGSAKLYSIGKHGGFNETSNTCKLVYIMPNYMASGAYSMSEVVMKDKALNWGRFNFHGSERSRQVTLTSTNPDTQPPVLNLNQISVSATPVNPSNPNGETIVTINYQVSDNISGFDYARIKLRDPQGVTHEFFHQPNNDGRLFFEGNPNTAKVYTKKIHLPAGSAPGIWGVTEISVYDMASNYQNHNFAETVLVEPTFNVSNN